MSIATDIVSLKIIAEFYRKKNETDILKKTVLFLVDEVPYIHWAGIYYYENENASESETNLVTSSSNDAGLDLEYNSELKFSIKTSDERKIGALVVRAKEVIAFDVTDVSTLEVIAATIGEQTFSN